jgi:hypothetical protein
MKFYVENNEEGMILTRLREEGSLESMQIQLRDGDIVETGHDPYPLLRVDSTKEEFYKDKK